MRGFSISGTILFVTGLATGLAFRNQESHHFVPKPGDTAVVYTHKFAKDKWKEARAEFLAHLRKQVDADHRHLRDSFILESPDRGEIIGITLWRSQADLDAWEADPKRNQNLKALDKYAKEPTTSARYKVLDEVIE